jgi:hypothetical protein
VLKERLLGYWKLVSWEVRRADGLVTYPFGPEPRGLLVYGANGLMSAQLGDPRRPCFAANDRALGAAAELKAAFEGYTAYFGRYEEAEDAPRPAVIHYPDLALFPNYIGSKQVRYVEMEGDRLTLSTDPISYQGQPQTYVLVWEKLD